MATLLGDEAEGVHLSSQAEGNAAQRHQKHCSSSKEKSIHDNDGKSSFKNLKIQLSSEKLDNHSTSICDDSNPNKSCRKRHSTEHIDCSKCKVNCKDNSFVQNFEPKHSDTISSKKKRLDYKQTKCNYSDCHVYPSSSKCLSEKSTSSVVNDSAINCESLKAIEANKFPSTEDKFFQEESASQSYHSSNSVKKLRCKSKKPLKLPDKKICPSIVAESNFNAKLSRRKNIRSTKSSNCKIKTSCMSDSQIAENCLVEDIKASACPYPLRNREKKNSELPSSTSTPSSSSSYFLASSSQSSNSNCEINPKIQKSKVKKKTKFDKETKVIPDKTDSGRGRWSKPRHPKVITGSCVSSRGRTTRGGKSSLPTGMSGADADSTGNPTGEGQGNLAGSASGQTSNCNLGVGLTIQHAGPSQGGSETAAASGSGLGGSNQFEESESDENDMTRLQALLEARGLPPHLFGALGHRMQHILHRSIGSTTTTKAHQLLQGLQAQEEGQQLQAVIEMCQLLVMGNEDTLAGFPVKQVVPALITLLSMEHNFDIMNHACRALTYMMEALPRSSAVVVEAIPVFLEKLQVIQCMDVAEQSLTALEALSHRHSKAILQAQGVSACLLYLDFFSINAQRSALIITANCCQNLLAEDFHYIKESVAILSQRLTHQDKKSVESVSLGFSRLVDNFHSDSLKLKDIAKHGLLTNLQQLLVISPPLISTGTFIMIIRMLSVMCGNCPELAVTLLKQNIADTLRYLLIGSNEGNSDNIELVSRSPPELFEIVSLISELMPSLPCDGIFAVDALLNKSPTGHAEPIQWRWKDDKGVWHSYNAFDNKMIEAAHQSGEDEISLSTMGRTYTIDFNSLQQVNEDTGTTRPVQRKVNESSQVGNGISIAEIDSRAYFLQENAELASAFIKSLFGVLYEVYSSSAGPSVRQKCLRALLRMVYFSNPELLKTVLKSQMVSSQLAAMMSANDLKIVVGAIQMAEILMQKLPDVFSIYFRREGVMHQLKKLADPDIPIGTPPKSQEKSVTSLNDSDKQTTVAEASSSTSSNVAESPIASSSQSVDSKNSSLSDSNGGSQLRLTEVLKRKRATRRGATSASRKSHADDSPLSIQEILSKGTLNGGRSCASPRGKSRFAGTTSKTTSFLANLNPVRWGRSNTSSPLPERSSYVRDNAAYLALNTNSNLSANKEKVKCWIRKQAGEFCEKYFSSELAGLMHPALGVLDRLTGAIIKLEDLTLDNLESLKEVSLIVKESDISPFEVLHSGLVSKLIKFLTDPKFSATPLNDRLRSFLHVFLNCPLHYFSLMEEAASTCPLSSLISKLNGCVNQLEQFVVKVHDLPAGNGSSRTGTSALKFFNTHQLKCNLLRHPSCTNLRQWKGGPVKVDPLALVQAIERYLVIRGYGKVKEDEERDTDDDNSEEDVEDTLAAVIMSQGSTRHKLQFMMGDHVLPYNMTVYQAVRQFGQIAGIEHSDIDLDSETPLGHANIWVQTHTIYYRPMVEESVSSGCKNLSSLTNLTKKGKAYGGKHSPKKKGDSLWNDGFVPDNKSPLEEYLLPTLPCSVTVSDPSLEVINLLRIVHGLNRHWGALYSPRLYEPIMGPQEFLNVKLSAKANRQLQDPLVIMTGNLPSWLSQIVSCCPFLFPFETRQLLFYAIAFDRDRAIQRLLDSSPELNNTSDTNERVTPRLDRKKRVVSRDDLLKQAEQVMQEVASSRSLLEIQYDNEVGTGLGPTLEFYTLVSRDVQRADLELWRGDTIKISGPKGSQEKFTDYIHSPHGLYPIPQARGSKMSQLSKLKSKFKFIGKFIAKAVMDSRMLDLPLNVVIFKILQGKEKTLSYTDMQFIDPTVARTFFQLLEIVRQKQCIELEMRGQSVEDIKARVEAITFDGCNIEDLGLDFTLPGYPHIELRKGGKDVPVGIHNLESYLKLVTHWTLNEGVQKQIEALKEGFESVFPLIHLNFFLPEELELVLCGNKGTEPWDMKMLMECCKPDHGYNHDSRAIKYLYDILSNYSCDEQRQFLQFVTGSPKLPVGGFKSLSPPLTIVRKTFEPNENPDDFLPSVMTCVNYLKLPDYSNIEMMRKKLQLAAQEGQHSFHLS